MANIIYESARGMECIPIADEMLKHREIFLTDQVDSDTTAGLIKELLYLESVDPSKEITLYINSPGAAYRTGSLSMI